MAANQLQKALAAGPEPEWRQGDSRSIGTIAGDAEADLVFSCPPFWNLEVCSEFRDDLSTMGLDDFRAAYASTIRDTVARLRDGRFAVWVIGDVRDGDGFYVNLPGRTVQAFEAAGARLYNDAILITAVGSLPIRAGRHPGAIRMASGEGRHQRQDVHGDTRQRRGGLLMDLDPNSLSPSLQEMGRCTSSPESATANPCTLGRFQQEGNSHG